MENLDSLVDLVNNLAKNSGNSVASPTTATSPDFSQIIGNLLGGQNTYNQTSQENKVPDLSSLISGILGNNQNQQNNTNTPDLNSILGAITGNNNANLGNLNLSSLANLFSNNQADPKSNLLTAAKPFLGDSFVPHIDHGVRLVTMAKKIKVMLASVGGL